MRVVIDHRMTALLVLMRRVRSRLEPASPEARRPQRHRRNPVPVAMETSHGLLVAALA